MSVSFADIQAAAGRLKGHAVETPLFESPALNERLGGRVLMKLETLQRVGAFKFRGAYNRLVQLDPEQRKAGVVAFSSGNHAQGVALAARLLGLPAVIVMPSDAPAVKVAATRGYGAEIRLYDRLTESREAISAEIARERGAVVVPAFDDPHIVAGQGTAGLEMMAQAKAAGATFDTLVSPVGGGGLLSGVSLVVKELSPTTEIWGAEPSAYDDLAQSLATGERVTIKPSVRTLCDALESPATGDITWPILKANLAGAVGLTDPEIAETLRYAFSTLKLVIEPGGAAGLAALLTGKVEAKGKTVGVVVSGGNVDPELYAKILRGEI
ncbi:MAG TPA: threonine/serine dehydratase [Phenylobacterium sp.]|jgi:threonine dehydratase|uniref:threonine ammonia-lyase n=1 Tax=Phenylobacterium sp. TaxID=1871053 RepID=UPI002BF7C99B|nr:threonine/serine dehydratase [Phenylobacterium sp.]HXA38884.1 threonine/serine dehydratase [Phenylobacterium sp.]